MPPVLSSAHWTGSYDRASLAERILQFGSGMLLRALCATAVDAANQAGKRAGRIVVVPSTPEGAQRAAALNAQDGLFTLVERGLWVGKALERTTLIGGISRAVAPEAAADLDVRVIISNVSEAGFRVDAPFPRRLGEVLHARFTNAPDATLFVIPTELVPDNGPRLAAMVKQVTGQQPRAFRDWITSRVRFCSSLVDRIVTAPTPDQRAKLESQLGYRDTLLTVTEPYALWAIECDPVELRAVLPIESASVVFAPDITFYRERKLRLLNALHTATAPLALLAGVRTVRDATTHPRLGPFMRRLLFEEIIPATDLPANEARIFAQQVLERFANPWLEHEWRIIATNQDEKFRLRVLPLILASLRVLQRTDKTVPHALALATAAHLKFIQAPLAALGDVARIPEFAKAVEDAMSCT